MNEKNPEGACRYACEPVFLVQNQVTLLTSVSMCVLAMRTHSSGCYNEHTAVGVINFAHPHRCQDAL